MSNIILQIAIVLLLGGSVVNMAMYYRNVEATQDIEKEYKQNRKVAIQSHLKRLYSVAA